jgi:predicted component of type VI protein secretion system
MKEAMATTFPASGEIPELKTQVWAPNLTHP